MTVATGHEAKMGTASEKEVLRMWGGVIQHRQHKGGRTTPPGGRLPRAWGNSRGCSTKGIYEKAIMKPSTLYTKHAGELGREDSAGEVTAAQV